MIDNTNEIDLIDPNSVKDEGSIDLLASSHPILSGKSAQDRATQFEVAASGTPEPPSRIDILSAIEHGTYNSLQEKLAADKSLDQRKVRYGQVQELISSGQKLTTEQQDFIMGLSEEKFKNPLSIVEEEFSKVLTQFLTVNHEDSDISSEETHKTLDFAENIVAKTMVARNAHENALAQYENMGTGEYVRGFKSWLPFYSWYNLSQANPDAQSGQEGIGQGAETRALVNQIWSIPDPGEMAQQYHETFQRLWEGSPEEAMAFSNAMQSYSNDAENVDQLWSALDVGTTFPLLKIVKGVASLAKGIGKNSIGKAAEKAVQGVEGVVKGGGSLEGLKPVQEALKNVGKVLAKDGADPVKVLDGAGLTKEAAKVEALQTVKATDDLLKTMETYKKGIPKDVEQSIERYNLDKLVKQTMTLFNPGRFGSDLGTKSSEYASRLVNMMTKGEDALSAALGQSLRVVRGTAEAYKVGLDEAAEKIKSIYNKTVDTVQDIRYFPPDQTLDNVAYVDALVGRPDGGGFRTELQARNYGRKVLGLQDQFLIEKNGMEHFIRVRRNVDETSDAFRTTLGLGDNKSVTGKLPAMLRWLFSPEDKFSTFMREQRSKAISGSQRVQALMRDSAKSIESLSGTEKKRLNTMMEINTNYIDPLDPESRGMFYGSINEYEMAYKKEFGEIPSEAATDAYFSAIQLNDIDFVFRNLGIYRDKARMGVENIIIDGLNVKPGKDTADHFEGKVVPNIPFDDGYEAGILVWAGPDDFVHVKKNGIKGEVKELLNKRITEQGWRVVQVTNPADRSFSKVTDKSVNFIIAKDFKQSPLPLQQIPYKPGFHVVYKDTDFVKQGRFEVLKDGTKRRTGDSAAMSASSGAKANKIAENLEQARLLMIKGDDAGLKKHLEENLPEEWDVDSFKNKFQDELDPKTGEVVKRAHFQKDVPFVAVKSGQSVSDAGVILKDGKGFHELFPDLEDPIDSPYNDFSKVNKQFAGQRDPTLDALDEGSEANPVYKLTKSNLARPIDVLQNSMATIIRNRYFEDLQIVSAENYVQEFGHILLDKTGKAFNRTELRRNPVLALHEASFDRKVDPNLVSQAKQIRTHTLNLLGQPSLVAQHISSYTDKLKNFAYEAMGEKGVKLIPDNMLHTLTDPFHYMRSIAFHTKLGLFNTVQLFTQGQALAVTTMVSPKYATRSMGATVLMRKLDLTKSDDIINHFADLNTKIPGFGMKKEAFIDSYKWLKQTGFDIVGQDHAWRGDIFEEKMFRSGGKKFLDKAAMFFNGTERFTRMNAWNTAYMEYVEKNVLKEGRINAQDASKILLRAKDLNVNMSRESNAIYQQGFASSFTQFFGYQARLTDLMLGKRLKPAEKFRIMSGMAALYGVSGPVNTLSPFYNFYEDIREAALARGIDPNAGLMGYVMNGIPAMVYGAAYGDQPNFGERFGPSGFPILKNVDQAIENDELPTFLALLEQAGGAGANITTDIVMDTYPLAKELLGMVNGGSNLNITTEAANNVLKNVSSYNQAAKMYQAMKTSEWVSSNGSVLMDGISTPQAIFYGLTGTQPQDIPDAFFMNTVADEFKPSASSGGELGKHIKEARIYMKNYLKARDSGDDDSARIWNERMTILLNGTGLTQTQKNTLFAQSLKGDTMVEAILKKFLKNGPPEQLKARLKTFGGPAEKGNQE
jgi:hypothetical protein